YQVSRRIRDMVVFSKQNLLRDAPFSRMDLVSCRNVLIYLQPSSQKKVLHILHYALNLSGYLMLGNSETVGDAPDLFSPLDRKSKIYAKRHMAGATDLDPAQGAASFNILRLARPELHVELKRNIDLAFAEDKRITADVKFYDEGKAGAVRLDLVPIQEPETRTHCLLVSFLKIGTR